MSHPLRPASRSRLPAVAALIAALCLVLGLGYWAWASRSSDVIYATESAFGRVWVRERADGLRSLYTGEGRARQSAIFPGRPAHLEIAYTRVAMAGLALVPEDRRVLFVGLGGGAMPMFVREVMPELDVEVVEIDPVIVDVAQRYFGFQPDSQMVVHTGDGRAFIEAAAPGAYDAIVLDAFSDDEVPYALTTLEFLEAVRSRLAPGGVVVSNLWSSNDEYAPMLATYDSVFTEVHLIRAARGTQRILIASADRSNLDRSGLVEASRALAQRAELEFDLPTLVEQGYERPPSTAAPVLNDARTESLRR